jgi:hypothetical protein
LRPDDRGIELATLPDTKSFACEGVGRALS